MQNAGLAALGLNWRYVAFDVHPDNLREAIAGARFEEFRDQTSAQWAQGDLPAVEAGVVSSGSLG